VAAGRSRVGGGGYKAGRGAAFSRLWRGRDVVEPRARIFREPKNRVSPHGEVFFRLFEGPEAFAQAEAVQALEGGAFGQRLGRRIFYSGIIAAFDINFRTQGFNQRDSRIFFKNRHRAHGR